MNLKETIEYIVNAVSPATVAPSALVNPADHQVVALREGYSLEELPRPRAVRPVRRHAIEDIGSLADYLFRHFEPKETEILAAPGKITAVSGHDFTRDEVTCGMAPAPAYTGWMRLFGAALNQSKVYAGINARREDVVEGASALSAFRTLEVHSKGDFKMNLMASGAVEFTATSAGVNVTGKIPDAITVRIPLYRGGPTFDLDVSIVPDLSATPPTFTLTARNLEAIKEQAFEAEMARLHEALGGEAGGYLITRGSCSIVE